MWFFRAVETNEGRWVCRRGRHHFDDHATLADAMAHLRGLAAHEGPVWLFAHHKDGRVTRVGEIRE
jgi:hypothetical protein